WGGQDNQQATDLLTIQTHIAKAITEKLVPRLSPEQEQQLTRRYTENTEAYQLYLRGRYHWNKRSAEGFQKAIDYFHQAIDMDPTYALAYAGLADTYVVQPSWGLMASDEAFPKAKAAARRALQMDENLAEAYATLGLALREYDWDWAGAEQAFGRALELNPNYATAHHWYAWALSDLGRHEEAIAEIKRAQELDPLSLIISRNVATMLWRARRYDEAIEKAEKALQLDPDFAATHTVLGLAYVEKEMYEQAIAELEKAKALSGNRPSFSLAYAYARAGKRTEALRELEGLLELAKREYTYLGGIAFVYGALGEKDRAFEWLERAYRERGHHMARLKVDPSFDSLRDDPRFQDLLRRVGLPED
ncbi:MAG: tetratricopeptide repeat protein, partial [Candidatus Acidoferrales bacterium]